MSIRGRERRGCVEQFQMVDEGSHSVHFDGMTDFAVPLQATVDAVGGAESGYLLIRFDVDSEPYSVVHVDAAAG